jgi:hypothetical protein
VILSGLNAGVVDVEFLGFHTRFTGVTQVVVDMGQGNDTLDASRLLNAVTLDVRGNEGNDTVKMGMGGGRVVDLLGDNNLSAFAESDAGVTFITGLGNDKLTGGRGNDVLFAGAGNNQLTGGAGGYTLYAVMGQNRQVGGEGADRYVFVGELGNNSLSEAGTEATDLDFSGLIPDAIMRGVFLRGAFTVEAAKASALVLAAFALVLTTQRAAVLWSFAALAVAIIYPYAKRYVAMPQAVLGVAFSFGIPMAFAAVQGQVPALAWVLHSSSVWAGIPDAGEGTIPAWAMARAIDSLAPTVQPMASMATANPSQPAGSGLGDSIAQVAVLGVPVAVCADVYRAAVALHQGGGGQRPGEASQTAAGRAMPTMPAP